MYVKLKQVEINDFKSFAGKNVIRDLKPLNAVVGTNGSGKSNFLEAIAFCFGETSNHLRAKNYQDFTNRYTPPNHNEPCYVKCIFELGEKTEISFTREINNGYIYKVNEQKVSRSEYQNELQKIGINLKSRYFINYQGEVVTFLSEDPKNRTALFEEITGSIEYKQEYDHLSNKISEIGSQIKHLKDLRLQLRNDQKREIHQVEIAEELKNMQKEYEKLEIKVELMDLYIIETKQELDLKKIEELKEEKSNLKIQKKNLETVLSNNKKELKQYQIDLPILNKKMIKIKGDISDVKIEMNKKIENVSSIENKIGNAEKCLAQTIKADEAGKRNVRELENQYEEIENQKIRVVAQFSQEFGEENQTQREEEYKSLNNKVFIQTTKYEMDLDDIKLKQTPLLNECANISRKITELECEDKKLDRMLEDLKTTKERKITELESLKKEKDTVHKELADQKEIFDALQDQINETEKKMNDVHQELQHMKDIDVNSKQIIQQKKIMDCLNAQIASGIHEYLHNFCEPIHPRYKIALAAALGKYASAIVVDSSNIAFQCITVLEAERLGKAGFLALDFIEAPNIREYLRDPERFEGIKNVKLMCDVVKCKDIMKPVIQFVLKDTLVCENTKDANHVAYKLQSKEYHNCVSLDGTFYKKNGTIRGGKHDVERMLAARSSIDKAALKDQLRSLQNHFKDLKLKQRELKIDDIKMKINSCEVRLKFIQEDLSSNQNDNKEDQMEERKRTLQRMMDDLKAEKTYIEMQIGELNEAADKICQQIKSVENKVFASFCRRLNISDIHKFRNPIEKYKELRSKISQYEQHLSKIKEQIDYEKRCNNEANVAKFKEKLKALQEEKLKEQEAIKKLKEKSVKLEDEYKSMEEEYNQKKEEVGNLKIKINDAEVKIQAIEDSFRANFDNYWHRVTSLKQGIERLREILNDTKERNLKISFSQKSFEILEQWDDIDFFKDDNTQYFVNKVSDLNMNIDYTEIANEVNDSDSDQLLAVHNQFKTKLAELGEDITANAGIQKGSQLETINEKLKVVIQNIRDKEKEAIASVKRFNDVKKLRCDKYIETFDKIAERVKDIYKEICGHTHVQAYLYLSNREEPYKGDVHYYCIPQNRKFVPCSELSGGEKTLAALTLMLAILNIDSSPILLLDEVDASLDNEAIKNFIDYIKKLTNSHQIIYATLNEKIMVEMNQLIFIALDAAVVEHYKVTRCST